MMHTFSQSLKMLVFLNDGLEIGCAESAESSEMPSNENEFAVAKYCVSLTNGLTYEHLSKVKYAKDVYSSRAQ